MYSIKKELLIMQSTTGKLAISARKYAYFMEIQDAFSASSFSNDYSFSKIIKFHT